MASCSYVWQTRYELLKVHSHTVLGDVAGRNTPWRGNAAASLHTTARDFGRFVSAVLKGTGLTPQTFRLMQSPQSRSDEIGTDTAFATPTGRAAASVAWGLGWGLEQEADGQTDDAIKAYERSLALNPANTAGSDAIKRLRESRTSK